MTSDTDVTIILNSRLCYTILNLIQSLFKLESKWLLANNISCSNSPVKFKFPVKTPFFDIGAPFPLIGLPHPRSAQYETRMQHVKVHGKKHTGVDRTCYHRRHRTLIQSTSCMSCLSSKSDRSPHWKKTPTYFRLEFRCCDADVSFATGLVLARVFWRN
ncbi:uncharacterized protein YALI1_B23729g [Yarrowia lipolytica]|uniref:Uncharacterized protein n=1 Tax=Yarrowia lipolytica TaxID=4952 RepID=A0A1D8N8B4_YARLL|nr:hypothetical protein YALI1_B23729g [Yarrowia lipolytica]